ncbi:unnamed protein product [Rhizopus stolonifer]
MKNNNRQGIELLIHPPSPPILPPLRSLLCSPLLEPQWFILPPPMKAVPSPEREPTVPKGIKRKRGRPPSKSSIYNHWTFVTPTVCSVKHQEYDKTWQWSSNEGIHTFMDSKMDMPLNMPTRKRGRKPKAQLKGNFCFLWRDLKK